MTITPIPPEPFNPKSFISWLVKIIIPIGIIGAIAYFLLPIAIEDFNKCMEGLKDCSNWGNTIE